MVCAETNNTSFSSSHPVLSPNEKHTHTTICSKPSVNAANQMKTTDENMERGIVRPRQSLGLLEATKQWAGKASDRPCVVQQEYNMIKEKRKKFRFSEFYVCGPDRDIHASSNGCNPCQ
jgi:hypothetical protein